MTEQRDARGRAVYACSAGETNFWRRQPAQIAGTLAFMMSRDSAEFGRVRGAGRIRAAEQQPLRECLLWLRAHNPLLRVFYSNAETFVNLYKQLQSLVPEGRPDTPVRLQRTPRVSSVVESTLQDTLGAETHVLVIVDPSELPRGFHSVDVLAE
eukprot:3645045-Lingulodinium_polyedra.AAC.1